MDRRTALELTKKLAENHEAFLESDLNNEPNADHRFRRGKVARVLAQIEANNEGLTIEVSDSLNNATHGGSPVSFSSHSGNIMEKLISDALTNDATKVIFDVICEDAATNTTHVRMWSV